MQIAKQRSLSNHGQSQRRQVETTEPLELGVQEGDGGQLLIQILAGIEAKRPYIIALDFQTFLRPWIRQQSLEHRAMTRSLLLTHIMQSFKAAH